MILVADDDADDRMLAEEAFAACDVTTEFVADGNELLAALRTHAGTGPPTVVLLDLNMPRMDGREALTAIRNDPRLATTPVVVLTTSRSTTDVEDLYRRGANAYHLKPDSFDELLALAEAVSTYWLSVAVTPGPERAQGHVV